MKRLALTICIVMFLGMVGAFAAPKKGTMKDPRDGKTYKTVQIGSQTWMAENLNYMTKDSYCYDNKKSNCAKYGRLYTWKTAQEACPVGWHLPSRGEFEMLIKAVGGTMDKQEKRYWANAGKSLKSTSSWNESDYGDGDGNGDDAFGFSALPAGYVCCGGIYAAEGSITEFWSSTEGRSGNAYSNAYGMRLSSSDYGARLEDGDNRVGHSVCCLKN